MPKAYRLFKMVLFGSQVQVDANIGSAAIAQALLPTILPSQFQVRNETMR
ncbi:MAG: hypothetical protein LDL41_03540 [Coleofasciculus sp. S288]|nr:hypothetical protein [Coleofasciculus sp. S288]